MCNCYLLTGYKQLHKVWETPIEKYCDHIIDGQFLNPAILRTIQGKKQAGVVILLSCNWYTYKKSTRVVSPPIYLGRFKYEPTLNTNNCLFRLAIYNIRYQ